MAFDAGSILTKMKLDRKGFSQGLTAVKTETRGLKATLGGHFKSIAKMGAVLTGVITGLLTGLVLLVKKVATTGDMYDKMSLRVGWSTEQLSTMGYAAEIQGSNLADLETGLKRFSRTVSDVTEGLTEAKRPFDALGISVYDTNGRMRESHDLFYEVADALGDLESDTKKAALAQELFGRGGMNLLPLLKEGAEGIRRLEAEGKRLGVQWSTLQAKQGADLIDSLTRLKKAFGGVLREAMMPLVPVLEEVTDSVTLWFSANRDLIGLRMQEFVRDMRTTLSELADWWETTAGPRYAAIVRMLEALALKLGMIQIADKEAQLRTRFKELQKELELLATQIEIPSWVMDTGEIREAHREVLQEYHAVVEQLNRIQEARDQAATRYLEAETISRIVGILKVQLEIKGEWDSVEAGRQVANLLDNLIREGDVKTRKEVLRQLRAQGLEVELAI